MQNEVPAPYHTERERGIEQRRRIVQYLRRHRHGVRYADIADFLDVSVTAAFWHVQKLRRQQVIAPSPFGKQRRIQLREYQS